MANGGAESSTGVSRRKVLKTTGAATGAAVIGSAATGTASAQSLGDAIDEQLNTCQTGFLEGPSDFPRVDVRSDDVQAQHVPEDPDEVMIYAIGWDAEGQAGYNQAYTLQEALREQGYKHPVIAAEWESNPPSINYREEVSDAGQRLADWIRDSDSLSDDTTIHLSGLSIGVAVPLHTLDELDGDVGIASTALFGSTLADHVVCTNGRFDTDAIEATAGSVFNYYSGNDSTTCSLFDLAIAGDIMGCDGMGCRSFFRRGAPPDNWTDVDVSDTIVGHCQYQQPGEGIVGDLVDRMEDTEAPDTGDDDDDHGWGDDDDDHGWGDDDDDHGWGWWG